MDLPTFVHSCIALIAAHAWIPLAALSIGGLVRVLKSDIPLPSAVVPPQYRPVLALGLGVVAGVIEAVATGKSWRDAVLEGLAAGATAIMGHAAIVDGMRGGRDIGARPPPTVLPGIGKDRGLVRVEAAGEIVAVVFAVAILTATAGVGCAALKKDAKTVVDVATTVCVLANGASTNAEIMALCGIEQALAPSIDQILSEHRAQLKATALRVCR